MNGIAKYLSPLNNKKNSDAKEVVSNASSPKQTKCKNVEDFDQKIIENMESVIKSAKKKHKHHKKKKNEVNGIPETEINDISTILSNSLSIISPNVSLDACDVQKVLHSSRKETPRKINDPTPKKQENGHEDEGRRTEGKENKINVFQMMMTKAINSSVGTGDEVNPELEEKKNLQTKRKLVLESLSEKKLGSKRKFEEIAQEPKHCVNEKKARKLEEVLKEESSSSSEDEPLIKIKEKLIESKKLQSKPLKTRIKRRLSSSSDSSIQIVTEEKPVVTSVQGKKDSLLGYFNKISPKTETKKEVEAPVARFKNGKPKKGPRKSVKKSKKETENEELVEVFLVVKEMEDVLEPVVEVTTASGRPKRSCASKIKNYNIFEKSPEKVQKKRKDSMTPVETSNTMSSPILIDDLDRPISPTSDTPKRKNVKLAPLFLKSIVKPQIDPEILKARQEFLMSGIPDQMRIEIERQKVYEDSILNESPVFPLVSHVQQLPQNYILPENIEIKLRKFEESPIKVEIYPKISFGISEISFRDVLEQCDLPKIMNFEKDIPEIENIKHIVREMKENYERFPVFKCFKLFRVRQKSSNALPVIPEKKESPKKRRQRRSNCSTRQKSALDEDDSVEFVEPKHESENGDLLFTEKYKPDALGNIFLNYSAALSVKKFLSSWLDDKKGINDDTEDNFEASNSSFSSLSSSICNYAVLVGPTGVGKTSCVYALANEMNFNVLEINASSRRKGKIILQELHEATQSHQVRSKNEDADMFKKVIKKTKNGKKSMDDSDSGNATTKKKLSLILIEDADIVFENDDGFVAAINQLISTSKRPIILTATEENCLHLTKHINTNSIFFPDPDVSATSKLLSIMSLIENVHLDLNEIAKVYVLNRKDLRKTINELQFFVQSGGDRCCLEEIEDKDTAFLENLPGESAAIEEECINDDESSRQSFGSTLTTSISSKKHNKIFKYFTRNQNFDFLIKFPINFDNLWCNMNKLRDDKKKEIEGNLDDLLFLCENISVAAKIQGNDKDDDRLVAHLSEDISHEIVQSSCKLYGSWEKFDELAEFAKNDRPTLSSSIGVVSTNYRSIHLDYEPYLRTICRSEEARSSAVKQESGRSRFYHYFRSYSTINSFGTEHFDKFCGIFEN